MRAGRLSGAQRTMLPSLPLTSQNPIFWAHRSTVDRLHGMQEAAGSNFPESFGIPERKVPLSPFSLFQKTTDA